MKKLLFLICLAIAIAPNAIAQVSATLSGYPVVTTGWTVGGDAIPVDSFIQLTGPSETQSGYVYYSTPVDLTTCSQFTVDFDFQIIAVSGTPVADGIAFWYISNPPSGFATGGGIGLPLNPNGLITILDSYNNNGLPDDNPLETLLYYNGTIPSYVEGSTAGLLCPVVTYQYFITDGSWHHCKMTYNAGAINVYFNYSTTASLSAYNPISITGYFGFSSSTGLYYSTQNIKDVNIVSAGVLSTPGVTSPVTYCQFAPATTLTATGTPLSWYATDTATVDSLPGAPTPNTSVIGSTTYYVREGSGTCQSLPDSIQVIVSSQPAAPVITGDTVYCTGDAFVPFTVTGSGIMWYTTPGGTGSATAPVVNTSIPGTYTFYASQSTSGCTSALDSIKVVVHATPAAPVLTAGDNTYCQFATFVPFVVTGTDDLWYTTPTGGTASTVTPTISTSVAATYNYYVSQTDSGCESPRLSIPVTVNPKPAAPSITPYTYCQYAVADTLQAAGTNLLWYGALIPGTGTSSAPTPLTNTPGLDSYYVTQTLLGCSSDSTLDVVVINPKPAPPVTADSTYCQYFNAPALTAIGSNLQWYTSLTGGSPLGSAPVPPTGTPGDNTWYVSQSVLGCVSDLSQLTITTIYVPQFNIVPSNPSPCQYDSINLAFTGPSLTSPSYSWILPLGAHIVDGTTLTGMPSIVVQFDSANQANYVYLTASDDSGFCTSADSIKINVQPQPFASSFSSPNVCLGDTVALALSKQSQDADNFIWYIDGTLLASTNALNIITANISSGGPFKVSWTDTGMHIIQLNSYSSSGCASEPFYDTVKVIALPNASFTYKTANNSLCIEDTVLFTATTDNTAYSYLWGPAHSFNNSNTSSSWGKIEQDQTVITLTVTDPFGCAATGDMTLSPGTCCTVAFPSAFTPNGDGRNDLFRPIFPDSSYHNFHIFSVANRWGQTIFESTNIRSAWDGNYNGVPQDMGVYYYYIKFDCGGNTVEQKGDVTLIR